MNYYFFFKLAVADAVRTSLGPKGMDKMFLEPHGEILITNDGATILEKLEVGHPCSKMLVELSKSQDIEAGDGTTSVVVIAGSLLFGCLKLLHKGIHPTVISEVFGDCASRSMEILQQMSTKLELSDRETLIQSAIVSLGSKVVAQNADKLAPIAVDAVMRIIDPKTATNVDLSDIKTFKVLGGTLDDTELVDGLIIKELPVKKLGGPSRIKKAKIALIQFWLSPPKPDIDHQVVVSDASMIDRILKEERKYIMGLCKKIKDSGCNVLLIQKSILRDATTEMSLHFLAKMGIMVVEDIDRPDVPFVAKTLGLKPVAHIDHLKPDKLGYADLVEEDDIGEKVLKITGIQNMGKTVSVLLRGSNNLVLDEADRSLHDALCVVRSLVKKKSVIVGGGAPEMELSLQLSMAAKELLGNASVCTKMFAECMEVIPTTLAENAGFKAIETVTELRNAHLEGKKNFGINIRKGGLADMWKENVIQPLLVSTSAISLATETVRQILKVDDILEINRL